MIKLAFGFILSKLKQEGDYILDAAEAFAARIDPRLPVDFVADQRALLVTLRSGSSNQKFKIADVGDLTLAQNAAFDEMNRLVIAAKESAKRAFKGAKVKLRNDFQVGINSPGDLASILSRARIIRDSCAKVENAPALADKGWQAADTAALTAAIDLLDDTDDNQEDAKVDKQNATAERNKIANNLYEALLTIQNAANIEFPDNGNGNTAIRAKFRIHQFPPKQDRKKKNPNGNGGHPTPPPA